MDLNRLMPVVLGLIPWGIALFEVRRGLTTGRMREYHRRDYTEVENNRPSKFCLRNEEPKTFWCLFAFYMAILIFVPVGIVYAYMHSAAAGE